MQPPIQPEHPASPEGRPVDAPEAAQITGRTLVSAWVLSLALHSTLFIVMFLVPWLSGGAIRDSILPIPNAKIVSEVHHASLQADRTPRFDAEANLDVQQDMQFQPRKADRLSELGTNPKPELALIGIGSGGGDFSKFGLSGGSGKGPNFFGLGENAQGARNIVYVVDRSGSMSHTFNYVVQELKRSIGDLRRSQKFHVIFFSSGPPMENSPRRLVSAIKAHKDQFFEFLGTVYPEGSTHPEQAMARAFACQPDLIYFLTDGEFDPGLVGKLDRLDPDRRVRIFTIAYFNRQGAQLLETIAREHRGEFRFVTENDLP